MDRISDSGSDDLGSNPDGVTFTYGKEAVSKGQPLCYLKVRNDYFSIQFSKKSEGKRLRSISSPPLR